MAERQQSDAADTPRELQQRRAHPAVAWLIQQETTLRCRAGFARSHVGDAFRATVAQAEQRVREAQAHLQATLERAQGAEERAAAAEAELARFTALRERCQAEPAFADRFHALIQAEAEQRRAREADERRAAKQASK